MKNLTFLYVEDDALSREAVQLVLERIMKVQRLYLFEESSNFLQRVQALPYRPDVILLDIHVKPFSGFEMLAQLRSQSAFQETKIIALTASVMNEEVKLLKQSGFNGVIGKPISITRFPHLIERVVRGESIWHVTDEHAPM